MNSTQNSKKQKECQIPLTRYELFQECIRQQQQQQNKTSSPPMASKLASPAPSECTRAVPKFSKVMPKTIPTTGSVLRKPIEKAAPNKFPESKIIWPASLQTKLSPPTRMHSAQATHPVFPAAAKVQQTKATPPLCTPVRPEPFQKPLPSVKPIGGCLKEAQAELLFRFNQQKQMKMMEEDEKEEIAVRSKFPHKKPHQESAQVLPKTHEVKLIKKMPIDPHLPEILEKYKSAKQNTESAVYIQSPTATGKTIRVPVEIARDPETTGQIFVAVSNVIAVRSCYEYVKHFFPEGHVGYACEGTREYTNDAKLIYVTKGYLIQYIIGAYKRKQPLKNMGTIMLDEAHDETIDSTMILNLVKYLRKEQQVNLIIASATSEISNFKKMFPQIESVIITPKSFEIEVRFHDTNFSIGQKYELINSMLLVLEKNHEEQKTRGGAVLVNLPGHNDLEHLKFLVTKSAKLKNCAVLLACSSQGSEENEKILGVCPEGKDYKIIIGTSITDNSLIIPDLTFGLNSNLEKIKSIDEKGVERLDEDMASKSTFFQRRGRFGREKPGVYYVMCTEETFNNFMDPLPQPEIERMHIHMPVLQLICAGLDPFDVLVNVPRIKINDSFNYLMKNNLIVQKETSSFRAMYRGSDEGEFVQSVLTVGIEGGRLIYHAMKLAESKHQNSEQRNQFICTAIFFAVFMSIRDTLFWQPSASSPSEEITSCKKKHELFKREDCFSTAFYIFASMVIGLGCDDECPTNKQTLHCEKHFNKKTRSEWCTEHSINKKTIEDICTGFMKTFERVKDYDLALSGNAENTLEINISHSGINYHFLFEEIFMDIFGDRIIQIDKCNRNVFRNLKEEYNLDETQTLGNAVQSVVVHMSTRRVGTREKMLASKFLNLVRRSKELNDGREREKEEYRRFIGAEPLINEDALNAFVEKVYKHGVGGEEDSL